MGSQQGGQPDIHLAYQRQRNQEVFAELPVPGPGRPRLTGLEGERVDEEWAAGDELDVVGAGVAQGETAGQRPLLEPEGQQGRVAQLAERPLVRVGDEPHPLGFEHRHRLRRRREIQRHFAVRYQQPAFHELGVEPRVEEGLVTLLEDPIDLAVERSAPGVDESAGVAVGSA
jgi:hypothetical protein